MQQRNLLHFCVLKIYHHFHLAEKRKKEENKIIVKQDGMITRKEDFIMKENLKVLMLNGSPKANGNTV